MSRDDNEWARNPGALAWAILPASLVQQLSVPKDNSCSVDTTTAVAINSTSRYYWPVILYPSWSYVAKQSGLFGSFSGSSDTSIIQQKVSFIGCKTYVTVEQMSKNVVPKKVALGCTSVKGQSLRPKVAAYFLGLSGILSSPSSSSFLVVSGEDKRNNNNNNNNHNLGTHCSWSAVDVQDVKLYSIENCSQMLHEYLSHSGTIMTDTILWSHLLLAMEEASIVSEQSHSHDPKVFMKQLNINHSEMMTNSAMSKARSTLFNNQDSNKNSSLMTENTNIQNNTYNIDKKDTEISGIKDGENQQNYESLTPECFNDWRLGGSTQKTMESQSQFILTAGTGAGMQ